MKARIRPSSIQGGVNAPPSKSYTHRAIALAALAEESELLFPLLSGDTQASINAARSLGATVSRDARASALRITGVQGRPATPADVINAENSGTTLRFFTAVAALVEGAAVLTGDASLRTRPNQPLLAALADLGAEAFSTKGDGTAPLVVRGKLRGGETAMDASMSSQFISALLIACPLAPKDSYLRATNLSSVPYMQMTLELLEQAGAEISVARSTASNDYSFTINGGQRYELPRFTVPGDFSSASYLLAAAAITRSPVAVRNLFSSAQGDARIVDLLRELGVALHWDREKGEVAVQGLQADRLEGMTVDMRENPDLVPTIAVLAAVAAGPTEITGVSHLRYKETDRLRVLREELTRMGAQLEERADGFLIEGRGATALHGTTVLSHGDHRVALALCIAALGAQGETVVEDVECVHISYPTFFEDLTGLGAAITLTER